MPGLMTKKPEMPLFSGIKQDKPMSAAIPPQKPADTSDDMDIPAFLRRKK